MYLGGHVHLGLPGAQLNDPLLRFSKNLYLCEQLIVDLCHRLSLVFGDMDSDQFSFAVYLGSLFAQSTSQVSHHLNKLSSGE